LRLGVLVRAVAVAYLRLSVLDSQRSPALFSILLDPLEGCPPTIIGQEGREKDHIKNWRRQRIRRGRKRRREEEGY
jgi:hypothetical protein